MKLGFVYLRATNLVCIRAKGPYQQSTGQAWGEMFAWLDRSGLRGKVTRGFGIAHDDPSTVPAERRRYDACIDLPEALPPSAFEHMLPQRLPGGAYARRRFVGPHSDIGTAFSEMRDQWRSATGVVVATDRPFVEIYLDDPKFCAPEKLRTDLCIPVAFAHNRDVA